MIDKVYIVTQGSYSDYHIVSVFTDKEQCHTFCAIHNDTDESDTNCWGNYEIEEYEVNTAKTKSITKPKIRVCVKFYGTPSRGYKYECIESSYSTFDNGKDEITSYGNEYRTSLYYVNFTTNINKTEEQIIKIATDKLMQYLAEETKL